MNPQTDFLPLPAGSKFLFGCETSGIVRRAFAALGHDVWSCDLSPAEDGSNRHIQGDIRDVMMMDDWSLMAVMHPPCTRLTNSGVRCLHVLPPGKTTGQMGRTPRGCRPVLGCLECPSHPPCRSREPHHAQACQGVDRELPTGKPVRATVAVRDRP